MTVTNSIIIAMFARILVRDWILAKRKQGRKFQSSGASVRHRDSHPGLVSNYSFTARIRSPMRFYQVQY